MIPSDNLCSWPHKHASLKECNIQSNIDKEEEALKLILGPNKQQVLHKQETAVVSTAKKKNTDWKDIKGFLF